MSILSPTDRTVLWRTATTSKRDERGSLLRVLAKEILESVGRRLDLYEAYEEEVIETVRLLDEAGLIGRDDLREAFEEADEDDERAEAFAALLARHLNLTADMTRLDPEARVRSLRLAAAWQEHLRAHEAPERTWLTAAEVSGLYGVTPQAVYKWLQDGRLEGERTPGGSWRVPAEQFERSRLDRSLTAKLKRELLERTVDAPDISEEELAEEIVARRSS